MNRKSSIKKLCSLSDRIDKANEKVNKAQTVLDELINEKVNKAQTVLDELINENYELIQKFGEEFGVGFYSINGWSVQVYDSGDCFCVDFVPLEGEF